MIDERKGRRDSEIMRDHAIRSGYNKRQNFHGALANELLVGDFGAGLVTAKSMIPKSVQRFSEKIMLHQKPRAGRRTEVKSSRSR